MRAPSRSAVTGGTGDGERLLPARYLVCRDRRNRAERICPRRGVCCVVAVAGHAGGLDAVPRVVGGFRERRREDAAAALSEHAARRGARDDRQRVQLERVARPSRAERDEHREGAADDGSELRDVGGEERHQPDGERHGCGDDRGADPAQAPRGSPSGARRRRSAPEPRWRPVRCRRPRPAWPCGASGPMRCRGPLRWWGCTLQ